MSTFWLNGVGFGSSILTITGILNALPYVIHIPEWNVFNLLIIFSLTEGNIDVTNARSFGWNILNTKKLVHWLMAVSLYSDGLWVMSPNKIPYFLPSLAILSKML